MKIVFSSNSRKDSDALLAHALTDSRRQAVINRAKDPDDELELLIVNNMLLTGFDAPPIHTMYLDRPLKGANLMQPLARVNRRTHRQAGRDGQGGRRHARRGEKFDPPLNWRELAFYDAVADHGTARSLMSDEVLAGIARELVTEVRRQLKSDWISRPPVRARLRSTIKRLLALNNYPPDQQKEAIDLVLRQMEHFANELSKNGFPEG